jgi:hypothetical protein
MPGARLCELLPGNRNLSVQWEASNLAQTLFLILYCALRLGSLATGAQACGRVSESCPKIGDVPKFPFLS